MSIHAWAQWTSAHSCQSSGVTTEDCVECAKTFARRASEELGVPLYLYEEAATLEYRKKLPQIREGEYEGLSEKIVKPEWKPDFGPAAFVPEWGATLTGSRFFLIAYNANILGTKEQAHRIALNIREAGRSPEEPGRLKECKAIGWFVEEYNMAQVSINLTNYKVTPPHIAFEECKKDAKALNIAVTGSELVGLIPLEAMLMAADYYMEKENLFILDEDQKIRLVVERLGLNSVSRFDAKKRIIEYMIEDAVSEPLASLTLRGFIESVAARTSAPGGGSASAAIAAIGSGLGAMVAQLTYGVKKFEHLDSKMRRIIPPLYNTTKHLIPMIDADTNAFNDYMEAMRLPKDSAEQKSARHDAMQAGLKKAIDIPLSTMRIGDEAWDAMTEVARYGNIASKSDVEVGARALETGIWGAYRNVMINMPTIDDEEYKNRITEEAEAMVKQYVVVMCNWYRCVLLGTCRIQLSFLSMDVPQKLIGIDVVGSYVTVMEGDFMGGVGILLPDQHVAQREERVRVVGIQVQRFARIENRRVGLTANVAARKIGDPEERFFVSGAFDRGALQRS